MRSLWRHHEFLPPRVLFDTPFIYRSALRATAWLLGFFLFIEVPALADAGRAVPHPIRFFAGGACPWHGRRTISMAADARPPRKDPQLPGNRRRPNPWAQRCSLERWRRRQSRSCEYASRCADGGFQAGPAAPFDRTQGCGAEADA
jgi:hypothetical protein